MKTWFVIPTLLFPSQSYPSVFVKVLITNPPPINLQKQQTRMAYEKEVDEIHQKYEAILQNAHTAFLKEQELLDARYNKVRVNKALAEAMVEKDSDAAVSVSQGLSLYIITSYFIIIV